VSIIPTVLAYLGLGAVIIGILLLFTGGRRGAPVLLFTGAAVAAIGLLFPAPEARVTEPRGHLDQLAPAWQFSEVHSITLAASCPQTWQAIKGVTAGEIRLFQTLTWIRRLGRPGPESILNAPANAPLLEVATRTGFSMLAEEAEREVVLGTTLIAPDRVRGFLNFTVTKVGNNSCDVRTETRVYAADAAARRRFGMYWRVIYPGSALIRRMWLRAIQERAEQ
jgi:hypothetical protein